MASGRGLIELGRAIADQEDEARRARERLPIDERLAAVRSKRARRGRVPLGLVFAVGAGLGAVAASVLLWPRGGGALRFAVGESSAPGIVGTWITAGGPGTPIAFSDGTRVALSPGARVRVAGVSEHGARIVLEQGSLSANVVPRAGNDWSAIAGPFEIRVTGTSFDATWDTAREELVVTMREGHVVVRGGCLAAERSLSKGDTARLSCHPVPGASSADAPLGAATEAVPPSVREVVPVRGSDQALPSAALPKEVDVPAPPPSFQDLARRGEYKRALEAAEASGFEALCSTLSASDLVELGTAARLARGSDRARLAYGTVRKRFPRSEPAATAAFLLGQMAFDGNHAFAESHRWFQTYLAERPGGSLAAEALGRLMEAEQGLGDLAVARATAARYVARFPNGAHAALAQSLLAP